MNVNDKLVQKTTEGQIRFEKPIQGRALLVALDYLLT